MKMEGDPHVTAWGVMRGQALDLITPQQVVGGLFLMNAEEKGCLALQPRLEILDEQGELMSAPHPLLSQHDDPLLGAGEGQQLGAGHCQSLHATEPWTGEEDGRLTLCTLNLLPPDLAQNSPVYKPSRDDQMPPLIIVPSEIAHLPLCPAPFSQESEQNHEVDVPSSADYLYSLLKSDRDSLVSALDLIPVSMNSLSPDLEEMPHQGREEALKNDQIAPLETCLPLITDQSCSVGPSLDPDVELLPHCNSHQSRLEPRLEQLSQSETLVVAVIDKLPQSESCQLIQSAPCLVADPNELLQSNVEPDPKQLPLAETFVDNQINSCLVPDTDQLPQLESKLELDFELLPQTKMNLDTDPEQLSLSGYCEELPHPYLISDTGHLPPCDSQFNLYPEQVPLPESSVVSKDLPQSISHLVPDAELVAQSESFFDPILDNLPHSEPEFSLTPDYDSHCPSETSLNPCVDTFESELLPFELDPPIDHHCLDFDIETFSLAESFMAHDTEPFIIESLSSLVSSTDPLTQPEISLEVDQIPNSLSILEHESDLLPWFELSNCPNNAYLPFSTHNLSEGESSMAHEADELSLCDPFLAPDHYELSASKSSTSITDRLNVGDVYLEPGDGQLSESETTPDMGHLLVPSMETLHQSEDLLIADAEHLLKSESRLDHNIDRLTDNDQLSKVGKFLGSEHVPLPPSSETVDIGHLPGLQSNLASSSDKLQRDCPSIDHLLLAMSSIELDGRPDSCLPTDDDFFLSETFLAHDVDHIPICDHLIVPKTDQLPYVKPDVDQTDPCRTLDGRLPVPEACLSPDNDQLSHDQFSVSKCSLSHLNDQLPQSESCSGPEINQLCKTEFDVHAENDKDQMGQCLDANGAPLTQIEFYLRPNIDQLLPVETSLSQENEQLPQSEFYLSPHDDLSQSEAYSDSDQFPQTQPHFVTHGDLLPQLETHLGLRNKDVFQCESHFEHPPHTGHRDFNHFPLFGSTGDPGLTHLAPCICTDVLSLTHNPDPLHSAECPLFDSSLTLDCDQLPLAESLVTPSLDVLPPEPAVVPTTGEIPVSEFLLAPSIDHFKFLETFTPPEPSVPHSTTCLALFDQLTFCEPSESPTTPHFSPSETPETLNDTNLSLCDSSVTYNSPSNTNSPSKTSEEFQFPWDWSVNLPPEQLSEVSHCDEPSQSSARQHDKPEDSFSIFCLDTPSDFSHMTPEADVALSDDLLSLCDVFSHLQTNHLIDSQSDQSPISTIDPTDCNVEVDQFLNTILQKDLESDPPSKPNTNPSDSPTIDLSVLDSTDFYHLDLLFEPSRMHGELASESLPQPTPRTSSEVVDAVDSSDPSWFSSNSMDKSTTSNNLDDSLFSQSDSPFISSRFDQSSPQLIADKDSLVLESPVESTQLPVIVVTDPLELLSDLDDHVDNILPTNVSPLDMSTSTELEMDAHLHVVELPPHEIEDLPELKPDTTDYLDSSEDVVHSHQTKSDSILGTTLSSIMTNGELPLTGTGSPFEGIKLRSHDSQDSASAIIPFGEGDPLLAFTLDNDSPCAGDELARLRAVFEALDRDKDGFVKMEDFVQFATVYGAEQVKCLTGYLDPAGLGVINFRDFYRGISEIQNEDLDMQLYDMGYPSEEEPACSVDFDDLVAFEVTEVTDSAYVGSESAYSECETFTDEDTGGIAAQEDPEAEGDGAGSRGRAPATPEGLELSLCDISGVTVTGQEEQFEDFGEGAEPDLFNSHCEDEQESFTQTTNASHRLTSSGAPVSERQLLAPPHCSGLGGLYCSQCHKHVNRLEDLSSRLRYLEMDSPDKRTTSRKEARRLHHSGFLDDPGEQPLTNMACDDTDLTDKVLFLEQRVSELERDAAMTGEQQNRLRQENLQLLHRAHALEEQLKDQELLSDEVQSEETRKHRDELRKMERDRGFRLSSLKARVQELENENVELHSQLPSAKAATQRLEEEKHKLLDDVEELQRQLKDHQEQNKKLEGKLSKEKHKQQTEKERCQEVIEELRRELEQTQLLRLEMEQRMGVGNSAALQEYNSRTKEAELEHEVRRLKQEQRLLKEQNEELNGQIINLSIQGAKNLFSTTFSDSLAAEISSVSRDELMEAIQKQEEINLRLQDYIDRIIVAIMETNPAILEVKIH
ncbi:rab11 family-interacting protein 3 isoform X1 [Ranitomeya variabilis]|uniref:rab11 family-interacting protein 3 isoform X1 n=1 Tax=Ranitomeya variabilis TaxID=490064 RepID=UPI00405784B0